MIVALIYHTVYYILSAMLNESDNVANYLAPTRLIKPAIKNKKNQQEKYSNNSYLSNSEAGRGSQLQDNYNYQSLVTENMPVYGGGSMSNGLR